MENLTGWIGAATSLPALLGALLAISEVLALIPGVKSNSVAQLLFEFIKKAKEFVSSPKP